MIRLNIKEDKEKIYNFLKDNKVVNLDYYFDYHFDDYKHYLLLDDDELLGLIIANETDIKVDNHLLKVSVLQDIIIKDNNAAYFDELFKATIDCLEHIELISLIKYSDKYHLDKYNFNNVYYKNIYTFDKYHFDSVDISGIKPIDDTDELIDIYAKMMRLFNGFEIRNDKYFKEYKAYLKNSGSNLFGLYKNGKLQAYFSFKLDDIAIIDECVYTDLESLKKIIAYTLKFANKTILKVSSFEHLEKYFKDISYTKMPYMMAKMNDLELFNRLYETDVLNIKEAMTLNKKPLWINVD